jgi:ankyrin repeat protein
MKLLIKAGGNVNQATNDGCTPLFVASSKGNVALVKGLIEAGGNVNQHSNKDATPLFIASMHGHIDIVRLLLQQPNIDIHTLQIQMIVQLFSYWYMATQNNHTDVVQLLANAGAK